MKLSIVIAVLDSHEIVRRYLLYLKSIYLTSEAELILVDDGSDPPLQMRHTPCQLTILYTHDKRNWTQGLARMKGIESAEGEYIFCTDIDHIISKEAFTFALNFTGDKAVFPRRFAYIDKEGRLVTDRTRLIDWGLNPKAIRDDDLSGGVHGNTWLLRRSIFYELGGYDLARCNSGSHLQGEDRKFNKTWANACREGKYKPQIKGPPIYYFPSGRHHVNGDDNPHGLFHGLEHTKWGKEKCKTI